jgi:hypothetical protein
MGHFVGCAACGNTGGLAVFYIRSGQSRSLVTRRRPREEARQGRHIVAQRDTALGCEMLSR